MDGLAHAKQQTYRVFNESDLPQYLPESRVQVAGRDAKRLSLPRRGRNAFDRPFSNILHHLHPLPTKPLDRCLDVRHREAKVVEPQVRRGGTTGYVRRRQELGAVEVRNTRKTLFVSWLPRQLLRQGSGAVSGARGRVRGCHVIEGKGASRF